MPKTAAKTAPAASKKAAAKPAAVANVANLPAARKAKEDAEAAALRKQLADAQAKIDELNAVLAKRNGTLSEKEQRRAAWLAPLPESKMAKANTPKGQVQRMDRNDLIKAMTKGLYRMRTVDLAGLFDEIVSQASLNGGMDGNAKPADVLAACLEVKARNRGKKGGK